MIKVINDWYIEVNVNKGVTNYVVRRGVGKKDKKGCFLETPLAYCGTLGSAIDFIRKQNIAESLENASCDLAKALQIVEMANRTFTEMLKRGGLM
jgi:hypothetical protein